MDANADNYDAAATVQATDQWGNIMCVYSSCDNVPGGEGCMYANNYGAYHDTFGAADCEGYGGTACGGSDDSGDDGDGTSIELPEEWPTSYPVTDNTGTIVFTAGTLDEYVGDYIIAVAGGNYVSLASQVADDGSGGIAVIGTDNMCGCDLANAGEDYF